MELNTMVRVEKPIWSIYKTALGECALVDGLAPVTVYTPTDNGVLVATEYWVPGNDGIALLLTESPAS